MGSDLDGVISMDVYKAPHHFFEGRCPACGEGTGRLVAIPQAHRVAVCPECGLAGVGEEAVLRQGIHCECGAFFTASAEQLMEIAPDAAVLDGHLCPACTAKLERYTAEVRAGAVMWRCQRCRAQGTIAATSKLAADLRAFHGVPAPGLLGVWFPPDTLCPECGSIHGDDVPVLFADLPPFYEVGG